MSMIKKILSAAAMAAVISAVSITAFAVSVYKSPAEAAAGVTGKTVEQVTEERQSTGKTYGEIAAEAGKLDEFKNEMLQIKKDRLDQMVTDGKITQEQADSAFKAMEENAANCDGTGPAGIGRQRGFGAGSGNGVGYRMGSGNGRGMRSGFGNGGAGRGMGAGTGICLNQ